MDAGPSGAKLEALVDELAQVLWDGEQARMLVLRAGFPLGSVPNFTTAHSFWTRVVADAANGIVIGGVRSLAREAARSYPGNSTFACYGSADDSTSSTTPLAPIPAIPTTPCNIAEKAHHQPQSIVLPNPPLQEQTQSIETSREPPQTNPDTLIHLSLNGRVDRLSARDIANIINTTTNLPRDISIQITTHKNAPTPTLLESQSLNPHNNSPKAFPTKHSHSHHSLGQGIHWVWYLSTAAAAAGAIYLFAGGSFEPKQAENPSGLQKVASTTPFASWTLTGGAPLPAHLGDPTEHRQLCIGRPIILSLAVARTRSIETQTPIEIVLTATPNEGPVRHFVFDIAYDDRFSWTTDGRALTFNGTLEMLAPLPQGLWTLQPSVGKPGSCSPWEARDECTHLRSVTVNITNGDRCDDGE